MNETHLSSMWEQVSKTAHIAYKEQNRAGPSVPEQTNSLWAWNKSSPTIIIIIIIIIIKNNTNNNNFSKHTFMFMFVVFS